MRFCVFGGAVVNRTPEGLMIGSRPGGRELGDEVAIGDLLPPWREMRHEPRLELEA
jgi:hypothetical protein